MSVVRLCFPLSKVIDLAEHAMAATEHSRSPYDDPRPAVPSLIWVKDDGIYLMSNGIPRQPGSPENTARIVYAHGHESGTHWCYGEPLGDDFVEYIDLTQATDAGALIDLIRSYAALDAWLVFTVSTGTFEMTFSPTRPTA
ncbi:DUF3085 domain-containing protein [Nocardia sp. CA-107356]|uniref:DUF3085 domain-containing protein n=1 Tax=Nocardia sp. CA-107356 TaxID=3239972 RepID=UPI003D92B051